MTPAPPTSTLFPYTTLFRSECRQLDSVKSTMRKIPPNGIAGFGRLAVNGKRRSPWPPARIDRKSTRLNSSHEWISYAVFCLKKNIQAVLNHSTASPDLIHGQ